uniref:Disease resistance protein Roq1-like winged-helix domain-containing protein n=1 Tax=Brassica oleracea var. oleracea TaxID=109376 RepID=A0A0D3E3Z0_BRAOL
MMRVELCLLESVALLALVRLPLPELYIAGSLAVSSILVLWRILKEAVQLEALADETCWFGPGSRVIVTTEDQELLEQHDISNTYHVDFPTQVDARQIFCRFAFRQLSAPHGFEKLVERVIMLCSKLPLGLRVMGSSLRRKKIDDWESILQRLENSLDQKINGVLRVGYNSLHKDDQFLFQLIACFFNYQDEYRVKAMLGESNLDVRLGLKTLVYKSLIQKSAKGKITMHKLLQQVGREAVHLQEPRKRQILIDAQLICDVLENDSDSTSVMGISFDTSTIPNGVCMHKLLEECVIFGFSASTRQDVIQMPEHLVELCLVNNKLEKLWQGIQPLTNLKKIDLYGSLSLKEVPDLSDATHLKRLNLTGCWSLVQIPSSIGDLHKLEELEINLRISLQAVPSHLNLAFDQHQIAMPLLETTLQEFSVATVERIPDWIKDLNGLKFLYIAGCPKLASLPELPSSLKKVTVDNCESLETVCFPFGTPTTYFLYFPNCFKLCLEAKRVITQQSFRAYFPGKEMPAEFHDHRGVGSSLTIRPAICKFRICLVLSPKPDMEEDYFELMFRIRVKGCPSDEDMLWLDLPKIRGEHLFIYHAEFVEQHEEMVFKFSTSSHEVDVTECGVQVLTDETNKIYESCSEQVSEDGDDVLSDDKSNGCESCDEPRIPKEALKLEYLTFVCIGLSIYPLVSAHQ